ncbi:hypothetical protein E2C01_019589 [Portunus trituberculatus]|uniref:Uncharacterized protein n=1 Tax=Portunus trituberculatus TaxID=210409 RepID=A0A5B7DXM7_PORTR|nr:hypothetical protein [Portunus trituberculatus]
MTQWNSHDLADKHSPVEAIMGNIHQHIARGEYVRFMNVATRVGLCLPDHYQNCYWSLHFLLSQ